MYRIVLQRGCRCVEIDMWDGDDDRPVVTHGHTMTSEVSLEDVLNIIREHAFSHGTDYPLILSLENHLSHRQQIKAASLICEILGDYLYRPDCAGTHVDVLPSPEKLRGRVLLKAKTGHSILIQSKPSEFSNIEDEDSDEVEESPRTVKSREEESNSSSSSGSEKLSKSKPTSKIAEEMSQLVFLAGGSRKILMPMWISGVSGKDKFIASSCVSVNEKKVAEVWESGTQTVNAIREYNSHGLTRVYPKGTRVDSSNYTPTLAHHLGCQIVALNWQKHDNGMAVNEARFLANNGCGYVLSETVRQSPDTQPQTLHLQLLSAFMLPKPKVSSTRDTIDPYCVIKLYDEDFSGEDDYCSEKIDSQACRSNGFSPVWKETALLEVKNRALAVIVLKVYDHDRTSDDDLVGYCAVPTSLLREGYRCFPLMSKEGEPVTLPSTDIRPSVLCNVKWT
ncbi:Phosphatidylinositol-specific phospholipase C X [Gracilaria domingensis]|nr:Phosphatidylinositol-specific phospholipase C X [Gracilaria domingensis]